jgi:nucleoside 2-deoxyribosyltransferase
MLSKGGDCMTKIFIICPVRNVSPEENTQINNYVNSLENQGYQVYWPYRDTDQSDNIGYSICTDNRKAIDESDEIHVWFNSNSSGTLFDLGMAWALQKKLVLINQVEITESKSFANVITVWLNA